MKTVKANGLTHHTSDSAADMYTEYVIKFRAHKGHIRQVLGLMAFCRRIDNLKYVKIGNNLFCKK